MAEAFHLLSPEDRARLRRTVDAAALERFLASIPPDIRRIAVLTFVRQRTAEDLRILNRELGDEQSLAELESLLEQPTQPPLPPHPVPPGSLSYVPAESMSFVVQLEPPREPELLALWRRIEPDFGDQEPPAKGAV